MARVRHIAAFIALLCAPLAYAYAVVRLARTERGAEMLIRVALAIAAAGLAATVAAVCWSLSSGI